VGKIAGEARTRYSDVPAILPTLRAENPVKSLNARIKKNTVDQAEPRS
jgi:hypothetical protein